MFLRISRNRRGRKVYEYAQIAERYREDGRQKTRILEYLGPVRNKGDLERYGNDLILAKEKEKLKTRPMEEFSILPSLEFGMMYASVSLLENLGIFSILRKYVQAYLHLIIFMVVSRLTYPSSDLALVDLAGRVHYPWSTLAPDDDNVYRALDKIMSRKDEIEIDIFHALKPDTSTVHYDLTSSYFEGKEKNDLVLFGYSRDRKRGKEQIVIGIVMADGIPIHHEVWPGNTVDPKTLEPTLDVLKKRFGIRNTVFIADRAFGRSVSLDLLDRNLYITAAYRWDQPYRNILMETDFTDCHEIDGIVMKRVAIDIDDVMGSASTEDQRRLAGRRTYIAVYNREREALDLDCLDEKIDLVRKRMAEIPDQGDLKKSLGKLRSLVKFTKNGASLNEDRIYILKRLAGRFLIVTNTDLGEDEVVSSYREQWLIERSFRTIKSFIEIRPVYHRKSDRIRAHVFVCVLSLLLSRIMEKRSGVTISEMSRQLSYLKVTPVRLKSGVVMIRSESEIAKNLLEKIGIAYPERMLDGARTKT